MVQCGIRLVKPFFCFSSILDVCRGRRSPRLSEAQIGFQAPKGGVSQPRRSPERGPFRTARRARESGSRGGIWPQKSAKAFQKAENATILGAEHDATMADKTACVRRAAFRCQGSGKKKRALAGRSTTARQRPRGRCDRQFSFAASWSMSVISAYSVGLLLFRVVNSLKPSPLIWILKGVPPMFCLGLPLLPLPSSPMYRRKWT